MIWIAIFAAVIAGVAVVSLFRPGAAIGLMVLMFGFEQLLQAQSSFFVDHGRYVNYGIAFTAVIGAFGVFLKNPDAVKPTGLQVTTLLLFGFALLSSFWTTSPDAFRERFLSQWPYFALYFVLGPIICYYPQACADAAKSTLILGVPIVLAIAVFCEWDGRGIRLSKPVFEGGRLQFFTPPLAAASCAAIVAILTIASTPKRAFGGLFRIAVLLVCCYIIIRTQSRGQLAAFCFVVVLLYPAVHRSASRKDLLQIAAISVALILVLYGVFLYVGEHAGNRWQKDAMERALDGRALMMRDLFWHWLHSDPIHWMIGLGVSSSFGIAGFYVHNVPIEVLCEFGIIGFGIYVAYFWKSLNTSVLFAIHLPASWSSRNYALGFIGIFVFLSVLTLKEGTLYAVPHLFFIGILIDRIRSMHVFETSATYRDVFMISETEQSESGFGEDVLVEEFSPGS